MMCENMNTKCSLPPTLMLMEVQQLLLLNKAITPDNNTGNAVTKFPYTSNKQGAESKSR